MSEFRSYRRKQIAELRTYEPGDDMTGVSVSAEDTKAGSPKPGDMIARNPKNHADQWLVAAQYFADNFEAGVMPATRDTEIAREKLEEIHRLADEASTPLIGLHRVRLRTLAREALAALAALATGRAAEPYTHLERVEQQFNELPAWIREAHPATQELRRLQGRAAEPTCPTHGDPRVCIACEQEEDARPEWRAAEPAEPQTCATCRHWHEIQDSHGRPLSQGRCGKSVRTSIGGAALYTTKRFGCTLHETRPLTTAAATAPPASAAAPASPSESC